MPKNKSPIKQKRRNSRSLAAWKKHFEFIFVLAIFSNILSANDLVLKYWQSKEADLFLAIDHLGTVLTPTTSYREALNEAKLESISVAQKWGIEVKFWVKRVKKITYFHDLTDDHIHWTFQKTDFELTFQIASLILWRHNCKTELKECMMFLVDCQYFFPLISSTRKKTL